MTREFFERQLQSYQTSSAPVEIKEKAIAKLHEEYFSTLNYMKMKQLIADIDSGSSELKSDEFY
jgi:hypothetical protein